MILEAARNWWDSQTKRVVSRTYTVYDYRGIEFNQWDNQLPSGIGITHPLLENANAIKRVETRQFEKRIFPNHRFSWVSGKVLSEKQINL